MSQANPPSSPIPPEQTLSLEEARRILHDSVSPISGSEVVAIRAALGRILADDVIAPVDVPAHDNCAMDGYAVRAADLHSDVATRLQLVGTALAGSSFNGEVLAGETVRVMTGAVLPKGSDTVVMQEIVQADGQCVLIPPAQKLGQHVRRAGEDLGAGRPALLAGKRIGPAELGLIASLGFAEVSVRRRLRVAFFSTGDELASIGNTLAPGQVFDSNRYTLFGALTRLGAELIDMGVVRDDPAAMETTFMEASAQADVILTTGGVSVGDADYVKELMGRLGEVGFWKINIKPGRPLAFGRLNHGTRPVWMFGLPGNPVAVMVTFYQLVADVLLKMSGVYPLPPRATFSVPCLTSIRKQPGRSEFPRGRLELVHGQWQVGLAGNQGSGVLRSMSEANCFIVLPEAQGNVAVGDRVDVQLFEGLF
jgi:molybdopterin molybdotransferase